MPADFSQASIFPQRENHEFVTANKGATLDVRFPECDLVVGDLLAAIAACTGDR
jgi:hypothetical protein